MRGSSAAINVGLEAAAARAGDAEAAVVDVVRVSR